MAKSKRTGADGSAKDGRNRGRGTITVTAARVAEERVHVSAARGTVVSPEAFEADRVAAIRVALTKVRECLWGITYNFDAADVTGSEADSRRAQVRYAHDGIVRAIGPRLADIHCLCRQYGVGVDLDVGAGGSRATSTHAQVPVSHSFDEAIFCELICASHKGDALRMIDELLAKVRPAEDVNASPASSQQSTEERSAQAGVPARTPVPADADDKWKVLALLRRRSLNASEIARGLMLGRKPVTQLTKALRKARWIEHDSSSGLAHKMRTSEAGVSELVGRYADSVEVSEPWLRMVLSRVKSGQK